MVKADDRILEFLASEGPHSPSRIAADDRITFQRKHINVRLLKLEKVGLVEKNKIGSGVYSITEKGLDYLRGELDARNVSLDD